MTPGLAYLRMWAGALNFRGRASRREFWDAFIANFVIVVILSALASNTIAVLPSVAPTIYEVLILVPFSALTVRRLHDEGLRGWWWLLNLIPFVGSLVLLVICSLKSDPEPNRWGTVNA